MNRCCTDGAAKRKILAADQRETSPYNINAYPTPEVMGIKDMVTQGEFFLEILVTSPWYFDRKLWGQDGRIRSFDIRG